jgi:phosphoribosylformylglycinamidine synthase subunit PurQ / glutaminase
MKPNKKIGVVRFPGTNCDLDVFTAIQSVDQEPVWLWHRDTFDPKSVSAVVLPGGFSYGDYLRCGALAAKAPVMRSVAEFAKSGGPVLGICNGFQVLCEAGLLPGALVRNQNLRFIDSWVDLTLVQGSRQIGPDVEGVRVRLPIAHGEGRYQIDNSGLKRLQDLGQVWWTYNDNVNGSVGQIAGVLNEERNVAGLMPHPERAMAAWMGGGDGRSFFTQWI